MSEGRSEGVKEQRVWSKQKMRKKERKRDSIQKGRGKRRVRKRERVVIRS